MGVYNATYMQWNSATVRKAHLYVVALHALEDFVHAGKWIAYIGAASGLDEDADTQRVVECGEILSPRIARLFFPQFDLRLYTSDVDTLTH